MKTNEYIGAALVAAAVGFFCFRLGEQHAAKQIVDALRGSVADPSGGDPPALARWSTKYVDDPLGGKSVFLVGKSNEANGSFARVECNPNGVTFDLYSHQVSPSDHFSMVYRIDDHPKVEFEDWSAAGHYAVAPKPAALIVDLMHGKTLAVDAYDGGYAQSNERMTFDLAGFRDSLVHMRDQCTRIGTPMSATDWASK